MQYPAQVMTSGVDGSFDELKNNVETKIYGHIDPKRDIADSLVHDEKDTTAIKNKIRRLGGGEWIVDLPAPTFDVEVPPPFSLTSLDIPEGHPAGDSPLNASQRESVNRQVNQRKNRTRNHYGIERLSAEELAAQNELDTSGSFSGFVDGDGESESDDASGSAIQRDSDDDDSMGENWADSTMFGGNDEDEIEQEVQEDSGYTEGEPSPESLSPEKSSSVSEQESNPSLPASEQQSPSLSNTTPMTTEEIQEHLDGPNFGSRDGITEAALKLSDQLHSVDYQRAALGLSFIARENDIDITTEEILELPGEHHQRDTGASSNESGSTPDGITPPDGSDHPNAFDYDESDDSEEEVTTDSDTASGSEHADAAENGAGGEDSPSVPLGELSDTATTEDTTGETAEASSDDDETGLGVDVPADLDAEALEAVGAVGTSDDDSQPEADDTQPHPTDIDFDAPLHESHSSLSAAERDAKDISEDDEKFMSLIADAFSENLPDYELTESMTSLRDRAGDPDVDKLQELGYIDEQKVLRKTYYSLTREGWRIIADSVPGNNFGDHMEKMKHRVGVYLTVQQPPEGPYARVESYAEYQGETYDVIGYDSDGNIALVAEVETASNNKQALIEDYKKLAEAPGESAWVFPKNPEGHKIWDMLEDGILEHEYSEFEKQNAGRLDDSLDENPEDGADITKIYSQLLSDGE